MWGSTANPQGIPEAIKYNTVTDTLNIRGTAFSTINPIYNNYSLFLQDDWRATNRFSVSLGLRWDINPSPYDGFDPHRKALILGLPHENGEDLSNSAIPGSSRAGSDVFL
jgi:outer membrane receptor protein involved in Fe transport